MQGQTGMVRRAVSISQAEPGIEMESVVSTSQSALSTADATSKTSGGRKSLAASVADRVLQEGTKSKLFPIIVLLMEMSYCFVEASTEVYSVYALGGYTSTLAQLDAIELMIKYRLIGCISVFLVGIVSDSYIGAYYVLIFLLCILTAFAGFHAVISLPLTRMIFIPQTKLMMARVTFIMFAIFTIAQPLKFVVNSRAIMESNYFREPRMFYAMYACVQNLGVAAGGTVLYFSSNSRYALCTIMVANLGLITMLTAFYIACRRTITREESGKIREIGVVEKAIADIIFRYFKYFDQYVLRRMIFKRSSAIEGDYRCFTTSANTQKNSKALWGIILVTLPLIAAFSMLVTVDVFYYVQLSMFYYYPVDPFPLLSMKGYIFLLLFPLVEFWIFPSLKKWSRSEASRQLTMVGFGAMIVSLCLVWSFVVYKVVRSGNEFWYNFHEGTAGHVAITNCLNKPVDIRSQFMNYILHDDDGWTQLPAFKTVKILNIPVDQTPLFHLEMKSTELAVYDEYYLPLKEKQSNWYVILPTGVFPFPPYCYRRNQRHIVMTNSYYGPATICIVCALTLCNGYVLFNGDMAENIQNIRSPLVHMTGRGTNISIAHEKIMTELIGEYVVTANLGGVSYSKSRVVGQFTRTDTFMLVVYESPSESTSRKNKSEETIVKDIGSEDDSDLIKTFIIKTSPRSTFELWWMYPTACIHALAEVIYQVSLWMFLFTNTPDQIRNTVFCFLSFLSIPAYWWIYMNGVMSLRHLTAMGYFYLAAVNCFAMIVYFFCILFFIHKLFKVKTPQRSSVELAQKRQSNRSMDEQKGE